MQFEAYEGFDKIKEALDENLYLVNDKKRKDLVYRCPFCGDSQKRQHHGHFYVSRIYTYYHCFRCDSKGHINFLLDNLKLNKLKVKIDFQEIKKSKIRVFDSGFRFENPQEQINNKILSYLSNRVQIKNNLILDRLDKINLIIDPQDFSKKNELEDYFRINDEYISFITEKNTKIIKRDITGTKERYHILWFTEDFDYYMIKQKTEQELLISNEPLKIVLGEGVFDVLVPYYLDMFKDIDIFISSGGSSSLKYSIEYLSKKYLRKVDLIFLCDWDYIPEISKLKKYISKYISKVVVLKNKIGKDFGSPPISIEKIC